MNITFYSINKKQNSTKRPADSGVTYDCKLKEECSILTPNIKLDLGLSTAPSFNYAYISDWGRYYFVKNWTFYNRLWEADLEVDVLGTYKTEIGNSSMYVLRSASNYDVRIIDTFYPTKYNVTYASNTGKVIYKGAELTNYFSNLWTDGYFCIGYLGSVSTGIEYLITNITGFRTLLQSLLGLVKADLDMGDDIALGLARQLANPLQYITSVYWIPSFNDSTVNSGTTNTINFGYYSLNIPYSKKVTPIDSITGDDNQYFLTIPITLHPQTATRGMYVNAKPFTKNVLVFYPFGVFELDNSVINGEGSIRLGWKLDIATGKATLLCRATNDNSFLFSVESGYGVNIQLSQLLQDIISTGGNVIQGVTNLAFAGASFASLLAGNVASAGSAATSFVQGVRNIGNAVESAMPTISTIGTNGSYSHFSIFRPMLYQTFYQLVDDDYDHTGRPLCKEVTINTLSGYVECRDGDISLNATQEEREKVSDYLVGGFFYE